MLVFCTFIDVLAVESRGNEIFNISVAGVTFTVITAIDVNACCIGIASVESSFTFVNVNTDLTSDVTTDRIESFFGFETFGTKTGVSSWYILTSDIIAITIVAVFSAFINVCTFTAFDGT